MLKKTLRGTVFALVVAAPQAVADPPRFVDLATPDVTAMLGEKLLVNRFSLGGAGGVKLRNAGSLPVKVEDTVSLVSLTLSPGTQIGLSCDAVRHLALSVDDSVVYESVPCGSLLRITDSRGGAQ